MLCVSPVEGADSHIPRFFNGQKDIHLSLLHEEMQILVVIPLRSVFLTANAGLPVPITGAAR